MAETKNTVTIVTLQKLGVYDDLVKKYINDADAKSLKSVKITKVDSGNRVDFFKEETITDESVAAFSVTVPETDLTEVNNAIKVLKEIVDKLDGADTVDGSVKKQVKDAKESVETKIGTIDDLSTTAKTDIVSAVNEVKTAVENAQSAGAVTVDTTTTTEGMAKSYTFKQNEKTIATIDIPKDMVVSSGTVEKNPADQPEGTYLVLTLANATNDKVYINVGTLVDIYTAKANATQIQLAIDSATREISATVVAGSIGTAELADNAIVTAKIADGNVTKAKLSTEVQTSLGKADTALQESDVTVLRTDVSDVKTSLAEGGDTANAIADAKKAGTDAQTNVDALAKRVDTIESTTYVEATDDEINALFK